MNSPELARKDQLIFVSDKKHLEAARQTASQAWVVSQPLVEMIDAEMSGASPHVVLVAKDVALAMSAIAFKYFRPTDHHQPVGSANIDASARISDSAQLGKNVVVGPFAVIGDHCEIGDGTIIGAHSVLEPHVKIGAGTHLHPFVYMGHHCETGRDCEIQPHSTIGSEGFGYAHDAQGGHHRITHFGRVVLGERVRIGANVQVDRGTFDDSRIGNGVIIDNHCHFGHNIQIGEGTIITGGVIAAGSVKIGRFCVIGGRTTIAGHLEITDHCQFGGVSGITKSVTEPGAYGGLPLQPLKMALKTRSSLPELPRLRKQMNLVLKKLGIDEDK